MKTNSTTTLTSGLLQVAAKFDKELQHMLKQDLEAFRYRHTKPQQINISGSVSVAA